MYYRKEKGKQVLDLKGDLILTHNKNLVVARSKSAAPLAVRNAKYVADIPNLPTWQKLRLCWWVFAWVFSPTQAIDAHVIDEEGRANADMVPPRKR